MRPLDDFESIHIAGGLIKKGRVVQTGQVGHDHTGIIIGASTSGARKVIESDGSKTRYYNRDTGNDANPGTVGSPKENHDPAAALVDGFAVTTIEQQDPNDLDLTSAATVVPLQAAIGITPKLTNLKGMASLTSLSILTLPGAQPFPGASAGGGGVLIMVTNNGIYRSIDGGTAVRIDIAGLPGTTGTISIQSGMVVKFHEGIFMISSADSLNSGVFRSTDLGLTWEFVTLDTVFGIFSNMKDVFFGNGRWFIIGSYDPGLNGGGPSAPSQALAVSDDAGLTWTQKFLPSVSVFDDPRWGDYGNGVAVAFFKDINGANAGFRSTDDGETWALITHASLNFSAPVGSTDLYACRFGNGLFMVIGNEIAANAIEVTTSPDGVTWTLESGTLPPALFGGDAFFLYDSITLIRAFGFWIAGGDNANLSISSDDGASWSNALMAGTGHIIKGIASAFGKIYASGRGGLFGGAGWHVSDQSKIPMKSLAGFDVQGDYFAHSGEILACTFDDISSWDVTPTVNPFEVAIKNCLIQNSTVNVGGNLSDVDAATSTFFCSAQNLDWANFVAISVSLTAAGTSLSVRAMTLQANGDAFSTLANTIISLDQSKIRSFLGNAFKGTGSQYKLKNSLIVVDDPNKRALEIVGFAATLGDIAVEFCTVIGSILFDNTGGNGLELFINSICTSNFDAITSGTDRMTVRSGDILGARTPNAVYTSTVRTVDPLFIDIVDFLLQRQVPYVTDGPSFAFDSQLVRAAIDESENGATVGFLNAAGEPRDIGAYNFDESQIKEIFGDPERFPRPAKQSVVLRKFNNTALLEATKNAVDVDHDPFGATEHVIITFNNLTQKFLNWIERQERRPDQRVFLSLEPDKFVPLPVFTVDGAQPKGPLVITVDIEPAIIWVGASFKIGENQYMIKDALPNFTQAVRLVLDRPLADDLSNLQSLTPNMPLGEGEFKFLPQSVRTMIRPSTEDDDAELGQLGAEFTLVRPAQP